MLLGIFLNLPSGSQGHTFLLGICLVQLLANRMSIFLAALLRYILGYACLESLMDTAKLLSKVLLVYVATNHV